MGVVCGWRPLLSVILASAEANMIAQMRRAVSRRKLILGAVAMGVVLAGLATGGYYLAVVDARCTLERAWGESGDSESKSFPPSSRTEFGPRSNLHGIELLFDVVSGETVQAQFVIRNTTDASIRWRSSSLDFSFDVVDPVKCEVVWLEPRSMDTGTYTRVLKPGEERTYTIVWDGTDLQGESVPPGEYHGFAVKGFGATTSTHVQWYKYTSPPIEFNLE